ncbi:hypothetical protein Vadar_025664 [Vaccinium darrowii]|uniref:Uncharacterized protein n=1 Tax=Vaccinium darrowii TaxID=229202 RepID=A0ACB7XKQ3_9ERIC|nr:hypothetical protein Vadar_025664 [Vaccinium darrowii]
MSKDFNVPPVISLRRQPIHRHHQNRRLPTAPFQPSRSSSSNPNAIPFMSFDIGSAAASSSTSFSAPSSVRQQHRRHRRRMGFDDEPPLLEELGINTRQIYTKTVSILNPLRVNANLHEDADLLAPFCLMAFVSRKWGLVVAPLACAIRPTSAITWAYVGILELLVTRDRLNFVFLEVAPIG